MDDGGKQVRGRPGQKGGRALLVLGALLAAAAICLGAVLVSMEAGKATGGSPQVPGFQEELDRQVVDSMMQVDFAHELAITDNGVRIDFRVPDGEGACSQKITIIQGEEVKFESGVLAPGNVLEYADASLHDGAALVRVTRMTDGVESGSVNMTVRVLDERERT